MASRTLRSLVLDEAAVRVAPLDVVSERLVEGSLSAGVAHRAMIRLARSWSPEPQWMDRTEATRSLRRILTLSPTERLRWGVQVGDAAPPGARLLCRSAYNDGVAFSLVAGTPAWLVFDVHGARHLAGPVTFETAPFTAPGSVWPELVDRWGSGMLVVGHRIVTRHGVSGQPSGRSAWTVPAGDLVAAVRSGIERVGVADVRLCVDVIGRAVETQAGLPLPFVGAGDPFDWISSVAGRFAGTNSDGLRVAVKLLDAGRTISEAAETVAAL